MTDNSSLPNSKERDSEDEGIVTMVDVLKAEEILEENADAVLGAGDEKNCTYSEGYLKRQALYSCLTCLPADGLNQAGVCLACSYHCHADHELVELYTKRNFRCDCGNSLFKGRKCTLYPVKSHTNEKNLYNQNFQGVYCSCSRPYPDPEDSIEDNMTQCTICEDWFHTRHLGGAGPEDDNYAELICGSCTDKLPFLQYYLEYTVTYMSNAEDKDESDANISVTDVDASFNSSHELVNGDTSALNKTSADGLSKDESGTEDKMCLDQNTCNSAVEEIKENKISIKVEKDVSNTPVPADTSQENAATTYAKEIKSETAMDMENDKMCLDQNTCNSAVEDNKEKKISIKVEKDVTNTPVSADTSQENAAKSAKEIKSEIAIDMENDKMCLEQNTCNSAVEDNKEKKISIKVEKDVTNTPVPADTSKENAATSAKEIKSETDIDMENDKMCLDQNTCNSAVEDNKEKKISIKVEKDVTNTPVSADTSQENAATSAKEIKSETAIDVENGCKLKNLKKLPRGSGATYWPDDFRKLLCVCSTCKEMYESHGVSYLVDDSDTVRAYEEQGKVQKRPTRPTQYERGMEALSSLDRVQQMEAILSYNEMKTHLSKYLAKFAENKKVVREEDIREFFTGMQARKRQKLDIPHNCR